MKQVMFLVKLQKKNKMIEEDLFIQNYMNTILSDGGVKTHFMSKLLPLLNSKINSLMETFDLPFNLTFNELLEEKNRFGYKQKF